MSLNGIYIQRGAIYSYMKGDAVVSARVFCVAVVWRATSGFVTVGCCVFGAGLPFSCFFVILSPPY